MKHLPDRLLWIEEIESAFQHEWEFLIEIHSMTNYWKHSF